MPRPTLCALASALVFGLLSPAAVGAQDTSHVHQPGARPDSNRVAVMSPMVLEQRLKMLGYTDVVPVQARQRTLLANTRKKGRALVVTFDPYTGKVTEVPGRLERRGQSVRLVKPSGEIVAPPR